MVITTAMSVMHQRLTNKAKKISNWQFQLLTSKFTPSSLCQLHSFYVHLSLYLVLFLPLFTLPSLSSFVSPPRPQGFRCQSVSVWRGLWPAAPGHTGAPGWYPASIPLHPHTAAAQRHVGSGRIAEPEVCVDRTGSEAGNVGGAGGRGGVLVQLLKLALFETPCCHMKRSIWQLYVGGCTW